MSCYSAKDAFIYFLTAARHIWHNQWATTSANVLALTAFDCHACLHRLVWLDVRQNYMTDNINTEKRDLMQPWREAVKGVDEGRGTGA